MDPVPVSPPEFILNDADDPDRLQSGSLSVFFVSPPCRQLSSAGRSASQEELDIRNFSDSGVGRFCPLWPRQARMDESASPKSSTVAEILRRTVTSDQRTNTLPWAQWESNPNHQSPQHLLPGLMMGPMKPQLQAQSPFRLNFLPGVCPSPLNLQALPPGASIQPELAPLLPVRVLPPRPPQDTCWMNVSPVASTSNPMFGLSPCVLAPCSPFLPPCSCLHLPEVRPCCWSSCRRAVPVHQPCCPGLLPRKAGEPGSEPLNVSPKSAASGKDQSNVKSKSEEKLQKNDKPDTDRLQANNTNNISTKSEVSPGSLPSWDEELLAERAFEEYMTIMDSLFPEEQLKQPSLDSNIDLVESTSDGDYLDFLLSLFPDALDLLAAEDQEQKEESHQRCAASSSNPVADGTSLMLEVILQEQPHQPSADSHSDPVTNESPQDLLDPPGSESDTWIHGFLPDDSMSLSNTQSTASGPLPEDPPASECPSTSSVAGSDEDPYPAAGKDPARSLTDSPPQSAGPPSLRVLVQKTLHPTQMREPEEQCSPRNIHQLKSSCLKDTSHPPKDDLNNAVPAPARLFLVADSCDPQVDGNSTVSVPEKQIFEATKGLQISQESESPGIFSELSARDWCDIEKKSEGENKESDTKVKGKANTVKIRRSQRLSGQSEKEKAGQSSEFNTGRAEERKSSEKSIKINKFTPEKDGVIYEQSRQLCEREESDFEEQSPGTKTTHVVEQLKEQHQKYKASEDKLPGNRSPVSPPAPSPQSPGARTDTASTYVTVKADRGSRRDEHQHPASGPQSPCVKACERNPKLSPVRLPRAIQPSQQQSKSDGAGATRTCDFHSLRPPSHDRTEIHRNRAATCRSSGPRQSPDQTAGERGGDEAEHQSLTPSPMKRHRQERGASEATQTRGNETEEAGTDTEIPKSPMKRAKWRSKAEVKSGRDEERKQTRTEKGDEAFGVRAPSTRSKTKDKVISDRSRLTGQEGEKTAGKTPSALTLPQKYKDFIFYKPKVARQKRQLNSEKRKQPRASSRNPRY